MGKIILSLIFFYHMIGRRISPCMEKWKNYYNINLFWRKKLILENLDHLLLQDYYKFWNLPIGFLLICMLNMLLYFHIIMTSILTSYPLINVYKKDPAYNSSNFTNKLNLLMNKYTSKLIMSGCQSSNSQMNFNLRIRPITNIRIKIWPSTTISWWTKWSRRT